MELTSTQYRAVKKAKILLEQLEGRMSPNEHCLFNEVCCDWSEIDFAAINYEHGDGVLTSSSGLIQPGEDVKIVGV